MKTSRLQNRRATKRKETKAAKKPALSPLQALAAQLQIPELVLIVQENGGKSIRSLSSKKSPSVPQSRSLFQDSAHILRSKPQLPLPLATIAKRRSLVAWAKKRRTDKLWLLSLEQNGSSRKRKGVLLAASAKGRAISPQKVHRLRKILYATQSTQSKVHGIGERDRSIANWLNSQLEQPKTRRLRRKKPVEPKLKLNLPPTFLTSLPAPPPVPLLANPPRPIVQLVQTPPGQIYLKSAQTMGAVSRIARKLAHEFNNYLSVILGYAALLQIKLGTTPDFKEELEGMQRAGDSATDLTSRLLSLGRLYQSANLQPVDVRSVLLDSLPIFETALGKDIHIELDNGAGIPTVQADTRQLREMFIQIANNARDAMPQVGLFRIQTRAVTREEMGHVPDAIPGKVWVLLQFEDNGCGMTPEVCDRIFEPFFTTKSDKGAEGIGCSIIYSVVHSHKGWIDVESEPSKGTTFRIYLPASV